MFKYISVCLVAVLLTSCATTKSHKDNPNRRTGIITPQPAPKEKVHPPAGHNRCYKSKPGFFDNVWTPSHRVCEYNDLPVKAIWIEGYWACTSFLKADGVCTGWTWKSAQWAKVAAN